VCRNITPEVLKLFKESGLKFERKKAKKSLRLWLGRVWPFLSFYTKYYCRSRQMPQMIWPRAQCTSHRAIPACSIHAVRSETTESNTANSTRPRSLLLNPFSLQVNDGPCQVFGATESKGGDASTKNIATSMHCIRAARAKVFFCS
jgi:hypothetical protein